MKKNYSESKNMLRDSIANKLLDNTKDVDFFIFNFIFNIYAKMNINVPIESELEEISLFINHKITHR